MANRGWDSQLGGDAQPSNARTTGRVSGTDGAEAFIRPADVPTGAKDDPLDTRGDVFTPPGNLSVC
jgi:hypothetical protein